MSQPETEISNPYKAEIIAVLDALKAFAEKAAHDPEISKEDASELSAAVGKVWGEMLRLTFRVKTNPKGGDKPES